MNLYTLKASECLLRRTAEKHNKVVCHWWLYNLPCYFAGCSLCDVLQKSASTTQSSVACSRRDRLVCVSGGDARYDTGCSTQLVTTFMPSKRPQNSLQPISETHCIAVTMCDHDQCSMSPISDIYFELQIIFEGDRLFLLTLHNWVSTSFNSSPLLQELCYKRLLESGPYQVACASPGCLLMCSCVPPQYYHSLQSV